MNAMQNHREDTTQRTVVAPPGADAFVHVRHWYFDGPEIRVCYDRVDGKRVVARDNGCYFKIGKNDGLFSIKGFHWVYEPESNGRSLQEYLDHEFGSGETELVSVAPAGGQLVVFYRVL